MVIYLPCSTKAPFAFGYEGLFTKKKIVVDNGRPHVFSLYKSIQTSIFCFRRSIGHIRRLPETVERSSKLITDILLYGYMSMSAIMPLNYGSSSTSDLLSTHGSASLQLTVCHRFLGVCLKRLARSIRLYLGNLYCMLFCLEIYRIWNIIHDIFNLL
jgi:hypothetical protein